MGDNVNMRVKWIRKYHRLTQGQFAERLGVTQQTVCQWEKKSRNIAPSTIKQICAEYGADENWLTTGEGSPWKMRSQTTKTEAETAQVFLFQVCSRIFNSLPSDIQDAFLDVFQRVADERCAQMTFSEDIEESKKTKDSGLQDGKTEKTDSHSDKSKKTA